VADINIEKKRGKAWAWLVALAVLALLAWLIVDAFREADEAEAGDSALRAPAMAPAAQAPVPVLVVDPSVPAPAVAAYVAHVRGEGEGRMGSDHTYTAEGIARMATALRELVQAHRGLTPQAHAQAERFYVLASTLVASPDSLRLHADWVSEAATSAASVMEGLSAEVAGPVPELREQVREVRTAADAIAPRRDLLQQQQNVSAFFREAADAMAMLVNPRP
jgi:hypothetical protein